MKPSLSYHIDLTGVCNLKCPACPMGRDEDYPQQIMTCDELDAIIVKARKESYPLGIWLYNFTEPFVHPKLPEMVRVVNSHGLPAYISTNLNISKNVTEVLLAEPECLMVSVSGFTQDVYSLTHTKGDIEKVKANIRTASSVKSKTHLRIHWHQYRSNQGQEVLMKAFVDSMPRKWDWHSYKAVRMDLEQVVRRFEGGPIHELERNLLRSLTEARYLCRDRKHYRCQVQDGTVSINSQGHLRGCGCFYDSHLPVKFMDTTVNQFLENRRKSDLCRRCTAVAGHVYAMELYDQPVHSIRVKLEELWRNVPMRGKLLRFSAAARRLKVAAKPK